MAIGFEAQHNFKSSGSNSHNWSMTTTAAAVIVVCVRGQENSLPSGIGVSGGGLTWVKKDAWAGSGGTDSFAQSQIWVAIASGPLTSASITAVQANSYDQEILAFAITGTNCTDASTIQNAHADNGAKPSLTTSAISLVIASLWSGFDQGGAGTGYTLVPGLGLTGSSLVVVEYKEQSSAGAENPGNGYAEDWRISLANMIAIPITSGGGGGGDRTGTMAATEGADASSAAGTVIAFTGPTTLNPADKDAPGTLSNGNLTLSVTGHLVSTGARSTRPKTSGSNAFRAQMDFLSATTDNEPAAGVSIAGPNRWGQDSNGFVLIYGAAYGGYFVYSNSTMLGSPDGTTPAPHSGNNDVDILIDSTVNRLYFTVNGNALFGANPVAKTGGIAIPAGPHYAVAAVTDNTITVDFSPSGLPSGWAAWDVVRTGTMAATEGADASTFVGEVEQDWDFLGVSDVVEVTGTSHALVLTGLPTLQQGDLLIACIGSRIASTSQVTLPSGWTRIAESLANNVLTTTSAVASGTMAFIVRGPSNPALTFTHPAAPSVALGRIVAYRPKGEVAKDTQIASVTAVNITSVSTTGLTAAAANELLVRMAVGGQEAAWSAFNAATSPNTSSGSNSAQTADPITGTWQERADTNTMTGADMSLAIADAVKSASGATGNLTATASLGASHVQITVAFRIISRTGTMAATEGADLASMSGNVQQGRTGTLAAVEGADVASAVGRVNIRGTLAATEGADATASVGKVNVRGTMACTDGADVAAISGTVSSGRTGTLAVVEGADGAAAGGKVNVRGTLAGVEGADLAAMAGNVSSGRTGTLAATDGADVAAAAGRVNVRGTMAATDRPDGMASSGLVAVRGTLAATDRPDVAAFIGTLTNSRTGTLAATDGADGAAAVGRVHVRGVLAATDRPDGFAAAGRVPVRGTIAATDGADTAAASGGTSNNRFGTLAAIEGADRFAAVGRVIGSGTILVTEGADAASFLGRVRVSGNVAATEGADLIAVTGKVKNDVGPREVEAAALLI